MNSSSADVRLNFTCTLTLFFACAGLCAGEVKPAVEGPEGQKAFDDLAEYYADGKGPKEKAGIDIESIYRKLAGDDAAQRTEAGKYLYALVVQLHADESNGRARWVSQPTWGGGSESKARNYRKHVAETMSRKVSAADALPAVRWMLENEPRAEIQAFASTTLGNIKDARANELIGDLLKKPHTNRKVLIEALEETGARKLKELAPQVEALASHYQSAVRDAARKIAPEVGLKDLPPFDPVKAITPDIEQVLADVQAMILEEIPAGAAWANVTYEDPYYRENGKPVERTLTGWMWEQDGKIRLIDWFLESHAFEKEGKKIAPLTLADQAAKLLALRQEKEAGEGPRSRLSKRGGLTGQFEHGGISQPEILFCAWAMQRGEKALVASILLPRLDTLDDARWLRWIARDFLARPYHQQMLDAFAYDRDYAQTLRFAKHLAKPLFDDYQYQDRAKELAAQLEKRGDDFKALALPTPGDWEKKKKELSREQQVRFLAERLRLINSFQWGQPGGVNYEDDQFAEPSRGGPEQRTPVINPYNELDKLKLEVKELPWLIPHLADENYLPTYSYWRDFHPSRTLHQTHWLVANLVNDIAHQDIADLRTYFRLDESGKKKHIENVLAWANANAAKTQEQIVLENLQSTQEARELAHLLGEVARRKLESAIPLLVKRAETWEDQADEIAQFLSEIFPKQAQAAARSWLKHPNRKVQFYGALALVRASEKGKKPEGYDELCALLNYKHQGDRYLNDNNHFEGKDYFNYALADLLGAEWEPAGAFATTVLKQEDKWTGWDGSDVLHLLFRAGRPEALAYILKTLDDTKLSERTRSGTWKDEKVERKISAADELADSLFEWRLDGKDYPILAPETERSTELEILKDWLQKQFKLIKEGKNPEMKPAPDRIRMARWRVDAP